MEDYELIAREEVADIAVAFAKAIQELYLKLTVKLAVLRLPEHIRDYVFSEVTKKFTDKFVEPAIIVIKAMG